jgi:hypothetical protein
VKFLHDVPSDIGAVTTLYNLSCCGYARETLIENKTHLVMLDLMLGSRDLGMKSLYLQYSKNLPYNIEKQVVDLNKMVIDECTNRIVPNILQYIGYIQDISSPIPIMPRSQNVSNKGYKFGDFSSLIPSSNSPYP